MLRKNEIKALLKKHFGWKKKHFFGRYTPPPPPCIPPSPPLIWTKILLFLAIYSKIIRITLFIGGNYAYSLNFASNLPLLFEDAQNLDLLFFADIADIWGVDYNSSIKGNGIRSSTGIALDWMSPIGPLNFSLAYPISKQTGDKTESFRFNLGTTF